MYHLPADHCTLEQVDEALEHVSKTHKTTAVLAYTDALLDLRLALTNA
jgi:hypothetical protein